MFMNSGTSHRGGMGRVGAPDPHKWGQEPPALPDAPPPLMGSGANPLENQVGGLPEMQANPSQMGTPPPSGLPQMQPDPGSQMGTSNASLPSNPNPVPAGGLFAALASRAQSMGPANLARPTGPADLGSPAVPNDSVGGGKFGRFGGNLGFLHTLMGRLRRPQPQQPPMAPGPSPDDQQQPSDQGQPGFSA